MKDVGITGMKRKELDAIHWNPALGANWLTGWETYCYRHWHQMWKWILLRLKCICTSLSCLAGYSAFKLTIYYTYSEDFNNTFCISTFVKTQGHFYRKRMQAVKIKIKWNNAVRQIRIVSQSREFQSGIFKLQIEHFLCILAEGLPRMKFKSWWDAQVVCFLTSTTVFFLLFFS